MNNDKAKILVIVEGAKTDVTLMNHLFSVYGIDKKHEIVSYNTNIYALYNKMFKDNSPETFDLVQLLKEYEKDEEKKKLFDERYSDIILIFDLDPHDPNFSKEKIIEMADFFTESSNMGKLYLNFPMVEAFYHMKEIPDDEYNSYIVTMQELLDKKYKERVHNESRNNDYRKFAVDKQECNEVIKQNIVKSNILTGLSQGDNNYPSQTEILKAQLQLISEKNYISVLCTCAFYIPDYNSNLIK